MKTTRRFSLPLSGWPLLALLGAACAGPAAATNELVTARDAYTRASSSATAQVNPAGTHEAYKALQAAEKAHEKDPGSDRERTLAYVATRKAELAMAQADEWLARQEQQKAAQAYQAVLEQRVEAQGQELEQLRQASGSEFRQEGENLIISLSGVFFETGRAELSPSARQRLDQIAEVLRQNPERRITIEGHTDSTGDAEANRELSQQRADAVRSYLVSRGISPRRVSSVGRGESEPVASNESASGRATNRRVDLVLGPTPGAPGTRMPVRGTESEEEPIEKEPVKGMEGEHPGKQKHPAHETQPKPKRPPPEPPQQEPY